MPVSVRIIPNGFVVDVPICPDSDGLARFDLASGSTVTEGRSAAGTSNSERIVHLVVSPATLADGSYNPDEVVVVSNLGELTDPSTLSVFVSTSAGFAEFSMDSVAALDTEGADVVGRSVRDASSPDTQLLAQWCAPTP